VLIEGDHIAAVGPNGALDPPPDAQVIELKGQWLLPGLIDLHSHMYAADFLSGHPKLEDDAYVALVAAENLRTNLMAGITTARDVGTQNSISLSVRRAVQEGRVVGSRVFACGLIICQTGGHGSELPATGREADGMADVRQAVREQWKAGADLIKVALNGAKSVLEFTLEELQALVDEAHRLNLRVACHASILPAAWNAALAGVDTIEHGCHLDEATVAMMVEKGITLVPTITALAALLRMPEERPMPPEFAEAARMRMATHRRSFELALQAGVRIGAGTDICFPYRTFAALPEELEHLVSWGMAPMDAIQAATKVAAEVLGQADQLGTIEPGKLADLVGVESDPLADIGALGQVSLVIQGGRVVKSLV
jgi:imidazolonepropionase-like amidohydrolase